MTGYVMITTVICAVLFGLFFVLFGYFKYKKNHEKASKIANIFLVQGILLFIIFLYLIVSGILNTREYYKTGVSGSKGEAASTDSASVESLGSSSINTGEGRYEYPSDPAAAEILTRGDTLLVQDKIQEAIDAYREGLKDKKQEKFKNVYKERISYANSVKMDYSRYKMGLRYFEAKNYEKATDFFEKIKANDMLFYSDVRNKLEQMQSGAVTP